jgi:hypothetical protein
MLTKAVIDFGDPLRIAAERFVRASFVPNYGARLTVFASYPLVIADPRDETRRTVVPSFQADVSQAKALAIASPVLVIDSRDAG